MVAFLDSVAPGVSEFPERSSSQSNPSSFQLQSDDKELSVTLLFSSLLTGFERFILFLLWP